MIVNSGLAFARQNNVAGATKQYFAVLIGVARIFSGGALFFNKNLMTFF